MNVGFLRSHPLNTIISIQINVTNEQKIICSKQHKHQFITVTNKFFRSLTLETTGHTVSKKV